ncbi:hypothetical protein, partial [Kurthia sibirica]|uniref:hypothetical protein n=1 Tax=Kurthia sibirica TaxID=202750 RepID=UPI001C994FD6
TMFYSLTHGYCRTQSSGILIQQRFIAVLMLLSYAISWYPYLTMFYSRTHGYCRTVSLFNNVL